MITFYFFIMESYSTSGVSNLFGVSSSRIYKEIHLSVSLLYTYIDTQRARYSLWLRNKIYIFKHQRKYAINIKTLKFTLPNMMKIKHKFLCHQCIVYYANVKLCVNELY